MSGIGWVGLETRARFILSLNVKGGAAVSWSFGDEAGWMIGAGVFCVIAFGIGWGFSEIVHRLRRREALELGRPVSRKPSMILGVLVGVAVFALFYFTALSGFMQLDYHREQLSMRYILPARTVVLPFIEVMNVQEVPEHKGRWRLVLTTDTSGTYESALSWQADVYQAAEWLRREMRQLPSAPRSEASEGSRGGRL
jgi:hypothetical protein